MYSSTGKNVNTQEHEIRFYAWPSFNPSNIVENPRVQILFQLLATYPPPKGCLRLLVLSTTHCPDHATSYLHLHLFLLLPVA